MGDFLLSVFHSTFDAQRNEGCLSLYYSNYIPIISFSRYNSHDNDDVQEYPFPTISSIFIDMEKEGDNCLNVFVNDQLFSSSIFRLPSRFDLLSFIQITVSNGILNSDPSRKNPNKWVPVSNFKPRDPIQWICDNSPNSSIPNFSLPSIYRNSQPPFCKNPPNGSFSLTNHREILRELIEKGKQTEIYIKLNQGSLKEEFHKKYFSSENRSTNLIINDIKEIDNANLDHTNDINDANSINKTNTESYQNTSNNYITSDIDNDQKDTNGYQNTNNNENSDSKPQNEDQIFTINIDLNSKYDDKNLVEYLNIRKQWETRISHQNLNNSKHNTDVEKILKDLPRTISNDKTILLLYNVLRTTITYAPDVGFAQGMVDLSYFIAQIVLEDSSKDDDESQSKVFWGLNTILFKFGQSIWFQNFDVANSRLISIIDDVLSQIYPSLATFVRSNNFELFKHCFGSLLTMFTRMLEKEIEEKLWLIIFLNNSVEIFHAAVLATMLCVSFPKLSESKVSDMSHITDMMNSFYLVENQDSFLAIVASICERIKPLDIDDNFDMDDDSFSCSLFKPL